MSNSDAGEDLPTGAVPAVRTVVLERMLGHPSEKVWRALTQPHLIAEWLMAGDFAPVEGHRFRFHNQPQPGIDVSIDCRVLTVEPFHTLAYTWDAYGLESVVTFTLAPAGTGTLLRMEQTGFRPDQTAAFKGARAGWTHYLAALAARLDHHP